MNEIGKTINCSTCLRIRQGRKGLLCTQFGTLVHRTDLISKRFKCVYYAEDRKKSSQALDS